MSQIDRRRSREGRPYKYSAHIGYLFTEIPLVKRIEAAARSGFDAVEHPVPCSVPASTMASLLKDHGVTFTQLAAASGDPKKGEKGLASVPGREADFREGFLKSLDYAGVVGAKLIHPLAGILAPEVDRARARDTFLSNIDFARAEAASHGISIIVEQVSEAPGFFANDLNQLAELLRQLPPGVGLLLDTYHATNNEVDIPAFIQRAAELIFHVHISDQPGRHQPGTGAINFAAVLRSLQAIGYRGALGFEYNPSATTESSLDWMPTEPWADRASDVIT